MEKTLHIGDREVKLKCTGATLMRYRAQFQRDALKDIFQFQKAIDANTGEINLESIDLEMSQRLMWIMAKTADPEIPDLLEWLDTFEEFPLLDLTVGTMELLTGCLLTLKKK